MPAPNKESIESVESIESIESIVSTKTRFLTGGTCLKILLAQFPVEPTNNYVQAILKRHNGDKNVVTKRDFVYESLLRVAFTGLYRGHSARCQQ